MVVILEEGSGFVEQPRVVDMVVVRKSPCLVEQTRSVNMTGEGFLFIEQAGIVGIVIVGEGSGFIETGIVRVWKLF